MDPAEKYFNCTDRERAAFEAGIKLGTIYHEFVGSPVSSSNVDALEKAIEEGTKVQPFVTDVKVKIDRKMLRKKRSEYDYLTLMGNMLDIQLKIRYKSAEAICALRYIREINYPLMYVREIRDVR